VPWMPPKKPGRKPGASHCGGWLTVCGGGLLGLWIVVCVYFVAHGFSEAKEAPQRPFITVKNHGHSAAAAGAPQQALRSEGDQDALGRRPLKKGASKYSAVERQAAAVDLVRRVVGRDAAALFQVTVTPKGSQLDADSFEIHDVEPPKHAKHAASGPRIRLTGTSGVSVASALNWYLRYYCKVDTSWMSTFPLQLPAELPAVGKPITRKSLVRWGYYENVCTHSYSQAWWDWGRWEREIDWMAMNGINLPLALTGQEAVMQRVFIKMGLTPAQTAKYFTGPAFLAWNRMINIKSWGGGLSPSWIDGQETLQHRILERERSLGMTPVLPGFAGGVPEAMQTVHVHLCVCVYVCVYVFRPK